MGIVDIFRSKHTDKVKQMEAKVQIAELKARMAKARNQRASAKSGLETIKENRRAKSIESKLAAIESVQDIKDIAEEFGGQKKSELMQLVESEQGQALIGQFLGGNASSGAVGVGDREKMIQEFLKDNPAIAKQAAEWFTAKNKK